MEVNEYSKWQKRALAHEGLSLMTRRPDRVSKGGAARMPARSVCLVTLSLSEAGPGRFDRQQPSTAFYHTIPYHTIPYHTIPYHARLMTT